MPEETGTPFEPAPPPSESDADETGDSEPAETETAAGETAENEEGETAPDA
jgi:hypothetical protein